MLILCQRRVSRLFFDRGASGGMRVIKTAVVLARRNHTSKARMSRMNRRL
jgi:hypothetical protein